MKQLLVIASLLAGIGWQAAAQSLDQAKKWYNERKYAEAKPAFERLVNQSPANTSYNLWYGVCCYETGDMAAAEKYLRIANQRKAPDSYRYLARICMQTYRFDEAATLWNDYMAWLEKRRENTAPFELELALAEKMQRLLNNTEDVQVIDSVVVDRDRILSVYPLSDECGRIDTYDRFFNTTAPFGTVYVNPKGDQAYYSRQAVLYTQSKLLDTWADESRLPLPADSTAENGYPFVAGDGVTLYFASKGYGSIGGYDLFVTRYNMATNSYLTPEQLGMPFNSPANDYLLVIDEAKEVGWFVSDRRQPEGKVCVYLFIPDANRKRIDNHTDADQLSSRAALTAIADSWAPGADYSARIRQARTNLSDSHDAGQHEIEFVVNDRLTYHRWSDFRSSEARTCCEKAVDIRRQLNDAERRLHDARAAYANADRAAREQLRASILAAEAETASLPQQERDWLKKARNAENRAIRQQ